jgi:hypothetical protein
MYAHIAIVPRVGNDFSVEVRHDDEGEWETYFNGHCVIEAAEFLDLALKHNPGYGVLCTGWSQEQCPINGYVFKIRKGDGVRSFFRAELSDPFANRRTYLAVNRGSTVSFAMVGTGRTLVDV